MGILSLLIVSISITILLPLSTILSMLCYNQLVMLVKNETTIEQLEFKDDRELGLIVDNPFDLGWLENVKQVLGDNVYLWAVPQKMVGDGTLFKVKNTFDL
jgi:hypothetical protein